VVICPATHGGLPIQFHIRWKYKSEYRDKARINWKRVVAATLSINRLKTNGGKQMPKSKTELLTELFRIITALVEPEGISRKTTKAPFNSGSRAALCTGREIGHAPARN
jgi:hypothetical protein